MTDLLDTSLLPIQGVPYWLMDGIGNDFVILDLRAGGKLDADAARTLGDRNGPWGCDQIIGIVRQGSDAAMTIYNTDGSGAGACGNAARCVAHLLMAESGRDEIRFGSPSGVLSGQRLGDIVEVDMGAPRLRWDEIPVAEAHEDTRYLNVKLGPIDKPVLWGPSGVSMGNPHAVFFVDDIEAHALDRFGPMIEHHPMFPEQVNVTLAAAEDETTIRARTWERGVGLTKACGTAACATLVSAVRRRLTGREATVHMPGGPLHIRWDEGSNHVFMAGAVSLNGQGVIGA